MSNAYRAVVSAGGGAAVGDATAADVLTGKTFSGAVGSGVSGTMPNNGAVTQTLNGGQSYTIPAGYHNGSGVITAAPDLLPAGKGLKMSNTAGAEAIDISSGSIAAPAGTAVTFILNVDNFDTLTPSNTAFLDKCVGFNDIQTLTPITTAANMNISSYKYVMFLVTSNITIALS